MSLAQIVGVSSIGLVIPRFYSGNLEEMEKETIEESLEEVKEEQSRLMEEVAKEVDQC